MKITKIETFNCKAGWRSWLFVKVNTDSGIVGWSECSESNGSPRGVKAAVKDLEKLVIGEDPFEIEKLYWLMYSRNRQSVGGVVQKAIAGIENALLDIKAKALGVPVYELLGGAVRESLPAYWSHCVTTRTRAADHAGVPQIKTLDDVTAFGKEIKKSGFPAMKTNILIFDDGEPYVYMPGFGRSKGGPELNISRNIITSLENYISALRKGVGGSVDIILDCNFNFKTEGYIRIAKAMEKFDLMWLEVDSYDPEALLQIKQSTSLPICSCENFYGSRQYRPYFEKHSMDIASIDVIWNGLLQSKKIADMAELYEMNVTPHNHYSHLAAMMSAHFCAAIPNFRILEQDVDDVPWKDELVTNLPKFENGNLMLPKGPGWGTEINEKNLFKHLLSE